MKVFFGFGVSAFLFQVEDGIWDVTAVQKVALPNYFKGGLLREEAKHKTA